MTLAEIDVMKSQVTMGAASGSATGKVAGETTVELEDRFKRMLVDRRAIAIEAFHGEDETTRIEKLKVLPIPTTIDIHARSAWYI